jgi:hypothetical protein
VIAVAIDEEHMPDEDQFARVLAAWTELRRADRTSIAEWTRTIEVVRREERDLRARGAWVHGRDDFFGILGFHRAEVKHSAMIAWLLDPCARHGLGTRFLAGFVRRLFPSEAFESLPVARTTCEVTRGDCRADIVVEMPETSIIIENKVDAVESPGQCDILFERFGEDIGSRFVLLTPTGKRPDSATGEAAEAFVSVSYADLSAVLEATLAETPTGHDSWGRWTAKDYLRTLRREFR